MREPVQPRPRCGERIEGRVCTRSKEKPSAPTSPFRKGEGKHEVHEISVNWLREFVDLPKKPRKHRRLLHSGRDRNKTSETRGREHRQVIGFAKSPRPRVTRKLIGSVCEGTIGRRQKRQMFAERHMTKSRQKFSRVPGREMPKDGDSKEQNCAAGVESEGMLQPIESGSRRERRVC